MEMRSEWSTKAYSRFWETHFYILPQDQLYIWTEGRQIVLHQGSLLLTALRMQSLFEGTNMASSSLSLGARTLSAV